MPASTITIRIDSEEKKEAARIADYFGFDLSSVTRAFYKQMIREKRIPLDLSVPEPNTESIESIRDAQAIIANGGTGRFKTAEDMFADLGI